jgi:hypothetical protein
MVPLNTVYRQSLLADKTACSASFQQWWSEVETGVSKFWSIHNLRSNLEDASAEDVVFSKFETIGTLIESIIQPALRELLAHVRIIGQGDWDAERVRALDFGIVVDQLVNAVGLKAACEPQPWGIRLNQWRNVAQHSSYSLSGDMIAVLYGKAPKSKTVQLTREQLQNLMTTIGYIFMAIGSARAIFTIEHHEMFTVTLGNLGIRNESKLLNIASALASQGFVLVDLGEDDSHVRAVISDATKAVTKERAAHAHQLVHWLWMHFPKENVCVVYGAKDDKRRFIFTVEGKSCAAYFRGEMKEVDLANSVRIQIEE